MADAPTPEDMWKNIEAAKKAAPPAPAPSTGSTGTDAPPIDPAKMWEAIQGSTQQAKPTQPEKPSTSGLAGFFSGLLRGGRDVIEGGAQIGARMQAAGPEEGAGAFDDPTMRAALPGRVDQAVRQSEQAYQQDRAVQAHPYLAGGGRVVGNIGATAPLMAVPGMGLGSGALRSGAGIIGRGALGGGIGGALSPVVGPPGRPQPPQGMPQVPQPPGQAQLPPRPGAPQAAPTPPAIPAGDYWSEKLKQVGIGAGIGAAIPAVGSVISPRLPSPQAVEAMPSGFARAFRPLYNFFTGAEERTENGFDRTIARQVLDPIGGQIDRRLSGHELLRETERQIGNVYDQNLPHILLSETAATAPNQELDRFVTTMSEDHIRRYNTLVDNAVNSHFDPATGNIMDGTTFQRARKVMGDRSRSWIGTNDDELGQAVQMKINQLQDAVVQTNPAQFTEPLKRANESWRLWTRMRAAGSKASKEGNFSPNDLLQAVTRQSRGASWSGDQPLQGYAQAARRAMGRTPASLGELFSIFHRHGIVAQGLGAATGPAARFAKAATPAISPAAGMEAAREQRQPRRSSLSIVPRSEPYVGSSGL